MSNLLGCILTHQLPFQTYLAAYFCFVDLSLLGQYLYYYKPSPSLPPSERSSPLSASTALLEDGLVHSVTERYGSTRSRRYSGVSASYPPPGLLPGSGDSPTCTHPRSRSRSCARGPSRRNSTLSKRATLQELQTTAANIAQAADSLLRKQRSHQRPRSASYVGDSRPSALSRTGMGVTMSGPRFGEPKSDTEDDEVDHLVESFYSEAGGSHPRHRSITWTTAHPSSSSQPQPFERREVVNTEDEPEDATLNGETHDASLRHRSRSRGRPTTRYLFESTPLDAVPGSYLENSAETSVPQAGETLITPKRPHASVSSSRASGKRSAGIVFLSVGVGALFVLGTHMDVSKEVEERRTSAKGRGKGQVIGVGQGYLVEDEENRATSNDYADAHTTAAHISYTYVDADAEPIPPPHRRHERPERTKEEKRRVVGRISAWICTTLYLTSRLPQIWKNVSAPMRCECYSLEPDTCGE